MDDGMIVRCLSTSAMVGTLVGITGAAVGWWTVTEYRARQRRFSTVTLGQWVKRGALGGCLAGLGVGTLALVSLDKCMPCGHCRNNSSTATR